MPKVSKNKKRSVHEDETARVVEVVIETVFRQVVPMRVPDDTTEADLEEICQYMPTERLFDLVGLTSDDWSQELIEVRSDEYTPVTGATHFGCYLKLDRWKRDWWLTFYDQTKCEEVGRQL